VSQLWQINKNTLSSNEMTCQLDSAFHFILFSAPKDETQTKHHIEAAGSINAHIIEERGKSKPFLLSKCRKDAKNK
jgi:hypothetical protein